MALERKPVEEPQEPGYPSSSEYLTGRRVFIGLLGLTALGVGGVYAWKSRNGGSTAGTPPPVQPNAALGGEAVAPVVAPPGVQAVPQGNVPGKMAPPELVQPQGVTEGEPPPVVRPQAQLEGDIIAPEPLVEPPPAVPTTPDASVQEPSRQPVALPETNPAGGLRAPVQPAQPEANLGGKPKPPTPE